MFNKIIRFAIVSIVLFSCKKQSVYNGRPINIFVFNGLDNGYVIYGNYGDTLPVSFELSQRVTNGAAVSCNFEDPQIRARYFVSPDTLPKDNPVFDKQLTLQQGKSYSLYLVGDKSIAEDVLIENNFQRNNSDSITYVQVVNISNDQPVSVNIKDEPGGSLVPSLAYKEATGFMALSADHTHPNYEFEFRDAATGELLFTEIVSEITGGPNSPNRFLYKNWTLVFKGKRSATDINPISVRKTFYEIN